MKLLLLGICLSLANFAWAEKLHGEFASDQYKKCKSMENCTTCLTAHGCDTVISQNMQKTIAPRKSNSSSSNGKASGLGQ